jgi:hypothetical protein
MDKNDAAWKLAEAAHASTNSGPDTLETALTDLKPSARDIARAYALCLSAGPFASSEAPRLILAQRLQVALVEEHVVLTVVLVILGGIDIYMRTR